MELGQMTSNLALAANAMLSVNGIFAIYNNAGTGSNTNIQVSAYFFKENFKVCEMVKRNSLECPIEVRAILNGITFFAVLNAIEFAELYPEGNG